LKAGDSGSQFSGETNLGRVAGSLIDPTKVRRHSVIGTAAHGKGMSDAVGYFIKPMVQKSVYYRRLLLQGTRSNTFYLAQHRRGPKGNTKAKEGMRVP
jgi:hypothetical protein